jgi:hypothetical protein
MEYFVNIIYSLLLLLSIFLAASRSLASIVVIFTDATTPWITDIKVLTIATGAEIIASNLKNGTPKTRKNKT